MGLRMTRECDMPSDAHTHTAIVPWTPASPAPSLLPAVASRGFFGSRPFSRVNEMLAEQGATPIAWGTPQA